MPAKSPSADSAKLTLATVIRPPPLPPRLHPSSRAAAPLTDQGRDGQDVECPHGQLHQGDGQPVADEAHEGHALPSVAQMPTATMLAEAPTRVALPPRVAPNIMAMNTGSVAVGQSVKPAARATSGTASAATR